MKQTFYLVHAQARALALRALLAAADGVCITIGMVTRSLEQNAAMWPILNSFSKQLMWPVNGALVYMTKKEWKDVLTAGFRQETPRIADGINGGSVMLGVSTREFSKEEFSEWLEFLNATAADRGVEVEA